MIYDQFYEIIIVFIVFKNEKNNYLWFFLQQNPLKSIKLLIA